MGLDKVKKMMDAMINESWVPINERGNNDDEKLARKQMVEGWLDESLNKYNVTKLKQIEDSCVETENYEIAALVRDNVNKKNN